MDLLNIGKNTSGKIIERQSTFLSFLDDASGICFKISYQNKKGYYLDSKKFSGFQVYDAHPLLDEYEHNNTTIFISSAPSGVDSVYSDISDAINKHYLGWRGIDNYCNTKFGIKNILANGSGLLYDGPPSGAEVLGTILSNHKVSYTTPRLGSENQEKYKVLMLGSYYVIAEGFEFNEIKT